MTALAIALAASVLGWKVLDVWNERTAREVESVVALTLRLEEHEGAAVATAREALGRIEEVEGKVANLELRSGFAGEG